MGENKEPKCQDIGLLVGKSVGGTIKNCHASGSIKINGNAKNVGGLVGNAVDTQLDGDCTADVDIEIGGDAENVGGIVGNISSVCVDSFLVEINKLIGKLNLTAAELTRVTSSVEALKAELSQPEPKKSTLNKIMASISNALIVGGAQITVKELIEHYDELLKLLHIN